MPESVKDRPTKAHEYLFLMSKSKKYYYDIDAIREAHKDISLKRYEYGHHSKAPNEGKISSGAVTGAFCSEKMGYFMNPLGRNKRSVWTIPTQSFSGTHFATFPEKLIEPCILAGSKKGDIVLDPFSGSCTVAVVAQKAGREWIMIDLSKDYCEMGKDRVIKEARQRGLF